MDHLRKGEPVPGSSDDLDAGNARAASDASDLPPEVVVAAVETAGRVLRSYLPDLEPDELDRSAPNGHLDGRETSVHDVLGIASWHVRSHLRSMRRAVRR
jgi:hypothetical protein